MKGESMNWGYNTPEKQIEEGGLLQISIAYLESKEWYFDHDRYRETWDEEVGPRGLREAECWTVPQWGDYWHKPYDDEAGHPNFGAPPERRYETLKAAIWSQILREQEPAQFEVFFRER